MKRRTELDGNLLSVFSEYMHYGSDSNLTLNYRARLSLSSLIDATSCDRFPPLVRLLSNLIRVCYLVWDIRINLLHLLSCSCKLI